MHLETRTFWLAKDSSVSQHYQDAFAVDERRGVAAIADGVSSSLFSAVWAKILTGAAIASPPDVQNGESFFPWLAAQRQTWAGAIDTSSLAWHQKAKLQQGAHSTLLWLQIDPPAIGVNAPAGQLRLRAWAIGDSCLFHARGSQVLRAFPLTSSALFDSDPRVLGSVDQQQDHAITFDVLDDYCQDGDLIVLCTDAIAAWALQQLEAGQTLLWQSFWNLSPDDWAAHIGRLREDRRMRYDDVTLMLLKVHGTARPRPVEEQETFGEEVKQAVSNTLESVSGVIQDLFGKRSKRRH